MNTLRIQQLNLAFPTTKRLFDIISATAALVALLPVILLVALLVKVTSKGKVLFWSDRVGINNTIFKMPKFRTMRIDTPNVATHLLEDPDRYLTPIGAFLRKFSLDELPQFWTVIRGQMSLVGPRPALYNQYDLIELRTKNNIHTIKPGITGWAQINGRDELGINTKVIFDKVYMTNQNLLLDLKILVLTFFKVSVADKISH